MSLAVDEPILNNPFEEPGEYWVYEERQPRRMPGRHPAGYYFRTGKRTDAQVEIFVEEQFKDLELVNNIRKMIKEHKMWGQRHRNLIFGKTFMGKL